MAVQTARVTFLTTPDFKAWLGEEVVKTGVGSLSELIRIRCQNAPKEEDLLFAEMLKEVKAAAARANAALDKGLKDANAVLAELKKKERAKE